MKRGFSLVEMLVVVGIVAILIAASLGSYNVFVRKASRALPLPFALVFTSV